MRQTEISNNSFSPSTLRIWYSLPQCIRESTNISQLRHRLDKDKPRSSMYNKLCTGKYGILLTRIRLEFSALNSQRLNIILLILLSMNIAIKKLKRLTTFSLYAHPIRSLAITFMTG